MSRRRLGEQAVVVGRAARSPQGLVGLALAGLVVAVAIAGPWLAPRSATEFVGLPFAPPSSHAWLGTEAVGRDALSRVLDGGRTILGLAALATLLGVGVGAALGVVAAYARGVLDDVIMRTLDVGLAFPQLILALLLVSIVGPKLWLVCLAVAAIHVPQVGRVVRAAALRVIEEDYVRWAEAIGLPRRRILVREVLPNVVSPLMVETGLRLTYSISIIASLSFLGFGLQPPDADWGRMINENRIGLEGNPWPVVVPVALIALLTIGVNLFTDAVARAALGVEAPVGTVAPASDVTPAVPAAPAAVEVEA